MQKFKLSATFVILFTLIIASSPGAVLSQSGRTRPRVPAREAPPPPPAPIKVPEPAVIVKQEQSGMTSRFTLRNGMTVIISEQHAAPIAAAVAHFKVGAADEPAGLNGVARLLGRVIVDTARARKVGAIIDGGASFEGSYYQFTASSEKFKEALAAQANAVQNPSFEAAALGRAATVENDSSSLAMARLLSLAFTSHPISRASQPAVAATREQLSEFHNLHYRPDNLIVAIVGDVSTFEALVEVQRLYGGFRAAQSKQPASVSPQVKPAQKAAAPPAPAPTPAAQTMTAVKPAREPEQTALRYGADRGDLSQSIVTVGYHVPGLKSKDWAAIEVLSAILGQGRGSQLRRSLLDGQAVVSRVESSYLALGELGLLSVQMWLAADAQGGAVIDKAESALFKEIERVRREVPADTEMARAKSIVEKRFVDRNETYAGRARELVSSEVASGSINTAISYRDLIRAVRPEDVQRVAGQYLTLANTSLHEFEPAAAPARTFDAASFSKTVQAWVATAAQPVDPKDARPADRLSQITLAPQGKEQSREERFMSESIQPLAVRDFSTLNGPRAFVREDHSRPKVSVAILFPGGRGAEDEATSGTTELMLRSMLRGTARRSALQVAHELDQLGADVRVIVEPDFSGYLLDVLSHNADRALKLLRDVTEEPAFRDEDIKRAQAEQIGSIRESRDDGLLRAKELMLQSLYPAQPYSLPAHGREEVVTKLDSEKIRAWHDRVIKSQVPTAIIVGDTFGSALVSGSLAEGFRRRDVEGDLKAKPPQPARAGERVESRQRAVTSVSIGLAGPKAGGAELAALDVLGSAFAFPVDAEAGLAGGLINVQLVTSPEDEARARAAVLQEFERVARAGLTADELGQAQSLAVASSLASLQQHDARALAYGRAVFHQQQPSEVDQLADRLSKVTAEEIKRAASNYFKPSAVAVGVVRGARPAAEPAPPKQD
ncbi:MAG TPA: pitrilysin family protein [Blastocatellia bacterium]|nr:pitrilysin family protein [Blastocatellia bacterium]